MTTWDHVRDQSRYFNRTVQEWHYRVFDEHAKAIDVDLGGYCGKCGTWLYIMEAAELWRKPVTQVVRLAYQTAAVGLLVVHQEEQVIGGQRVSPDFSAHFEEPALRHYLTQIRAAHAHVWHRTTWDVS